MKLKLMWWIYLTLPSLNLVDFNDLVLMIKPDKELEKTYYSLVTVEDALAREVTDWGITATMYEKNRLTEELKEL